MFIEHRSSMNKLVVFSVIVINNNFLFNMIWITYLSVINNLINCTILNEIKQFHFHNYLQILGMNQIKIKN